MAAVGGALAMGLAVMLAQAPSALAARGTLAAHPDAAMPAPQLRWQACSQYSDDVLAALGFSGNIVAFRTLWARSQCGTLKVPLDYTRPHGRQITIAFTRLSATDQAHRLGSLALNPGGPGGSAYLMPVQLALPGSPTSGLNTRYDLLGVDLRGIGYSSKLECPSLAASPSPGPGLTEAQGHKVYDAQTAANRACVAEDPAFMAQETTANAARDINRLRIALHQDKLSYLGLSWGTALGAVYRSLFPATVGRMWLDSVVGPADTIGDDAATRAAAAQREFGRFAAWIAAHNSSYGFGTTADQVSAALLAMSHALDAKPLTFTDISQPIDGNFIARLSTQSSPSWPENAEVFKELRGAKSGTAAPPAVKQLFTSTAPRPPADTPEQTNQAAKFALTCNARPVSFAASWHAYQLTLARYPFGQGSFGPQCAGWPLPVRAWPLRRNATALQMSGHRWEVTTPYPWARQMQSLIGGNLFTIDDDVHGDAPAVPACAAHIIGYFDTGTPGTGHCTGSPMPTSAAPSPQPTTPTAFTRRP